VVITQTGDISGFDSMQVDGAGLTLILISAILLFSFGAAFILDTEITKYWPALLNALGLISRFGTLIAGNKRNA